MNKDHPAMKELLTAAASHNNVAHLHFDSCLWQDNIVWCLSRIGKTALAWVTSRSLSTRALCFSLVSFIDLFKFHVI